MLLHCVARFQIITNFQNIVSDFDTLLIWHYGVSLLKEMGMSGPVIRIELDNEFLDLYLLWLPWVDTERNCFQHLQYSPRLRSFQSLRHNFTTFVCNCFSTLTKQTNLCSGYLYPARKHLSRLHPERFYVVDDTSIVESPYSKTTLLSKTIFLVNKILSISDRIHWIALENPIERPSERGINWTDNVFHGPSVPESFEELFQKAFLRTDAPGSREYVLVIDNLEFC